MNQKDTTITEIRKHVESLVQKMKKQTISDPWPNDYGSYVSLLVRISLRNTCAQMTCFGSVRVEWGLFRMDIDNNVYDDDGRKLNWDAPRFSKLPFCQHVILNAVQQMDENFYNQKKVAWRYGPTLACWKPGVLEKLRDSAQKIITDNNKKRVR